MLKFFFNRFSFMVRLMEAIGVMLLAITLIDMIAEGATVTAWVLYSITLTSYAFLRYCTSRRWYRNVPRYSGIELHFHKAIVPMGYLLTATLPPFLMMRWSIFLAIPAFILVVTAHINIILLVFHHRDDDPTPASYYTSGEYLKEETK